MSWDGCTATFVRSSSGIINETNRSCPDGTSPDSAVDAPIWVQFRPLGVKSPNPACGSDTVATGTYTNSVGALNGYFVAGQAYNVCFYLVNNTVATGTIDAASIDGSSVNIPLAGKYRIGIAGTWQNGGVSTQDAEFTTVDGTSWFDGYDLDPYLLGEGFGDTQVNGSFVNWGPQDPINHVYSTTVAGVSSLNLAVFDGDSDTNTKEAGWYGDNTGLLSYTVTYLGQT